MKMIKISKKGFYDYFLLKSNEWQKQTRIIQNRLKFSLRENIKPLTIGLHCDDGLGLYDGR